MRKIAVIGALFSGVMWASWVRADSISLGAAHDNTLYQDANGALSNGAGEGFFAGRTSNGLIRRGLIMFDVAAGGGGGGAIPAGAIINNATLVLHLSQTSAGALDVSLHRVLQAWGEGVSDAPGGEGGGIAATPGDATWLHTFFSTSLWTNPGGDFAAGASASQSVNAVGFYSWSSAGLTADVQSFLDNPSGNFGWLLRGNESLNNTSKRFDTRENLTPEFRPMLIVEYTPVPGPAGWICLALLGAGKGRRRPVVRAEVRSERSEVRSQRSVHRSRSSPDGGGPSHRLNTASTPYNLTSDL